MAAPRTVLIVNPKSQKGRLGRRWPHMAKKLRRELGSFEERLTTAAGEATELARTAIEDGAERVVAVGGDGTINEVVNGFFNDGKVVSRTAQFGVIPSGTGGDFRKTLRVPNDPSHAAVVLARGNVRRIDVGKLEYTRHDGGIGVRMFINIASFGLSGVVDNFVNASSKRFGKASFFWAATRGTFAYDNKRVRLEFDGNPNDAVNATINTVAVANGRYFGAGMFVAPEAELDDGFFDVVVMGDFNLKDSIVSGGRIYKGTHLSMDKVSQRRARIVHAEPVNSGDEVLLDVDGETPGRLPATFSVMPGALNIVAPA